MAKKLSEIIEKINKDEFRVDYCDKLLSTTQLCEKYAICLSTLNKVIDEFELSRDHHAVKSKSNSEVKNRKFNSIAEKISYDDIYKYYITEGHTYKETAEYFNIKPNTFDRLLKHYDIKQDRSIAFQKGLQKRIEKYGADNITNKAKRADTIRKKYGSEENFYKERIAKTIETNQERYGKNWKIQSTVADRSGDLYLELQNDREKSVEFFNSLDYKPSFGDLCLIFNCTNYCVYNWIERLNLSQYIRVTDTNYEDAIIDYIESLGIERKNILHNTRKMLDNNQEIDIYLPDYKLGIEFNGNYWHSSINVKRNYHFNKSRNAEEKGIRLIHIYQYEWSDPIKQKILKSILANYVGKVKNKIYARECEIKYLQDRETVKFLNENHLQGYRPAKIRLGLFYKNELVQIMTFSKNNQYGWEIIRECTKIDTTVIGGVSRLFAKFVKEYSPESVLSYCDYNKFQGKSYEKLGMSFVGFTGPDMKWLLKNNEVISRHPEKHKEIKNKAVGQIYGSGSKKYLIKFSD